MRNSFLLLGTFVFLWGTVLSQTGKMIFIRHIGMQDSPLITIFISDGLVNDSCLTKMGGKKFDFISRPEFIVLNEEKYKFVENIIINSTIIKDSDSSFDKYLNGSYEILMYDNCELKYTFPVFYNDTSFNYFININNAIISKIGICKLTNKLDALIEGLKMIVESNKDRKLVPK